MKLLLIHADNMPKSIVKEVTKTGKVEVFKTSQQEMLDHDYSFDWAADKWLRNKLTGQDYDCIVLPFTLSEQNYLELTGLRMAMHIRLTPELGHHVKPILFLGSESPEQIAKLSDLGGLLFTTGVFSVSKFTTLDLERQLEWIEKHRPPLSEDEYSGVIKRLHIDPAVNYNSHHALDNDLALVQWSEHIGCDDAIIEVKRNLQTGLYFKYNGITNKLFDSQTPSEWRIPDFKHKGKIVLIDDEANKGWATFYERLFLGTGIEFLHFSGPFTAVKKENIIANAKTYVEREKPDVVVLDLRLHDDDFKQGVPSHELSGVRILNDIKELNEGTQVIVSSASNKIWNFQKAMIKAEYYIVKGGSVKANKVCLDICKKVDQLLGHAKWLKKWHILFNQISQNAARSEDLSKKFKAELLSNLKVSFHLLKDGLSRPELRSPSYLQLFHIVEKLLGQNKIIQTVGHLTYVNSTTIVSELVEVDSKNGRNNLHKSAISFEKNPDSSYSLGLKDFRGNLDTNYKMAAVLTFRFGYKDTKESAWINIRNNRNTKCAHPGVSVSIEEVDELICFINFLFDPANLKILDSKEGLDDSERMKASLSALTSKFNSND